MFTLAEVTPEMKAKQWSSPQCWAMPFASFMAVIEHIVQTSEYKALKKDKLMVNFYDVNRLFVKKWTASSGCSLAVMMTGDRQDTAAELMLSHSWGEDVEEFLTAMRQQQVDLSIGDDTMVWFCVFSNYQCEDQQASQGPTIKQQLAMEPFTAVIESDLVKDGYGMVVIHTTADDLYRRLWCLYELHRAVEVGVPVHAAMSDNYLNLVMRRACMFFANGADDATMLKAAGIGTSTCEARCGYAGDEEMLIAVIMKGSGFQALDQTVQAFRVKCLPPFIAKLLVLAKLRNPDPSTALEGVAEARALASIADRDVHSIAEGCKQQVSGAQQKAVQHFVASKRGSAMFAGVDLDGNGVLELSEWMQPFDEIDAHKSVGVITRKQWVQHSDETSIFDHIPRQRGYLVKREEWESAFQKLDKEGNGTISMQDWNIRTWAPPPQLGVHDAKDKWWCDTCFALGLCYEKHPVPKVRKACGHALRDIAIEQRQQTPEDRRQADHATKKSIEEQAGDLPNDVIESVLDSIGDSTPVLPLGVLKTVIKVISTIKAAGGWNPMAQDIKFAGLEILKEVQAGPLPTELADELNSLSEDLDELDKHLEQLNDALWEVGC